jgi:hypothetical protein
MGRGGGFRGGNSARSSTDSATGGLPSVPVNRAMARAMLSCSAGGRLRMALRGQHGTVWKQSATNVCPLSAAQLLHGIQDLNEVKRATGLFYPAST